MYINVEKASGVQKQFGGTYSVLQALLATVSSLVGCFSFT